MEIQNITHKPEGIKVFPVCHFYNKLYEDNFHQCMNSSSILCNDCKSKLYYPSNKCAYCLSTNCLQEPGEKLLKNVKPMIKLNSKNQSIKEEEKLEAKEIPITNNLKTKSNFKNIWKDNFLNNNINFKAVTNSK